MDPHEADGAPQVALPHVFRNVPANALNAVLALIPIGVCVGYAVVEPLVVVKIVMGVLGAVGILFAFRVLRSGILMEASGVTVRGLFRDQRFAWSEITDFGPRSAAMNSTVYLSVQLTDGRWASSSGLLAQSRKRAFATRTLAAMHAVRQQIATD